MSSASGSGSPASITLTSLQQHNDRDDDDDDDGDSENDDAGVDADEFNVDIDVNVDIAQNLYKTIKSLRVATLSIHNRLVSIKADSDFVQQVSRYFGLVDRGHGYGYGYGHGQGLPLIANERCGSWYIPPWLKAGSVYFKSTDGHHGQWAFSLRRLNLNLLGILGGSSNSNSIKSMNAAMIVDSTRRGKRVPDALAKTVGIWCAVINATLFPAQPVPGIETETETEMEVDLWQDVGQSERSQIQARLQTWCDEFRSLGLDLHHLRHQVKRPIRCLWVVNGEFTPEDLEDEDEHGKNARIVQAWKRRECNLLVLCSASRVVKGAEMSQGGYIQGSGDDHEGWSHGLTPDLFWTNQDRLEGLLSDEEMIAEIERLVREQSNRKMLGQSQSSQGHSQSQEGSSCNAQGVCIEKVGMIYLGVGPVRDSKDTSSSTASWDLIINCQGQSQSQSQSPSGNDSERNSNSKGRRPAVLDLNCRAGKLGSKDLRAKLSLASQAFLDIATRTLKQQQQQQQNCRVLVTCNSGKDLSVGVAVVLLCLFYDDDGKLFVLPEQAGQAGREKDKNTKAVDKHLVKQRLTWITLSKADANPSRATLQAVNSFLIKRPVDA